MFSNELEVKCGGAKQSDAERMNELAKAVRSGDIESFDELYRLASSKAKYIAWKKGARKEQLFDIVQEAMLRLYRDIAKVDYVSAWLSTVVARLVIDAFRKDSNSCEQHQSNAQKEDADGKIRSNGSSKEVVDNRIAVNPEAAFEKAAVSDAVLQILTLLPDQQRKALYLSFVEQKKQDEIAGVLGISRSTVAAHIRMGKANFRREFAAHYDVSLFGIKAAYGLEAA